MLNKNKIALVLGTMCFALTCGICVQIRTVKNYSTSVSNNYKENALRGEVLKYKEKYDNKYASLEKMQNELEKERKEATKDDSTLKEKEEKIKQGNKLLGLEEVSGPGVIVKLADAKKDINNILDPSSIMVHDLDILSVINELENAGAEAISINDHRILPTSGIICAGNIVEVNGEKVGAPFVIKAIGLPEQLAAINRPYGYLDILKSYGIRAELRQSNNITIPKHMGTVKFNYAKTIN